ncbi:MAG: hypothetical protein B7Y89_07635 [Novosphingobium sp. 32-60-15]|uniref:tyrosine-type recombinase/integrase n=1 Tax=unclassified Novosphingobium TaxID=2644732 RepID=UPI000BD550DC|nr:MULTISPECIES: site-specific integrase [unclassified Novosphingobium]OYX62750.1 MAG: hypothetical protein B7Y89_07635 [Novosphingobium sp. 32-60-15]
MTIEAKEPASDRKPTAISKRTVDAFTVPKEGKQAILWDAQTKGFGLLAMPSGTKTYIFQYRIGGRAGKLKRYTIGRHGEWTPDRARKEAEILRAEVVRGNCPIEAKRAKEADEAKALAAQIEADRLLKELAFSAYVDAFIKGLPSKMSDRTKESYAQSLRGHAVPVLKDKPLPQITTADLINVLDGIPASQPAVRRNVFATVRILMNWAIKRRDIEASPIATMDQPEAVESRDRVLSDEELPLILRAIGMLNDPLRTWYLLLFMTGQRREECAGADWSEFDRATASWTLPSHRTKNGKAHLVPLADSVLTILDRLAGQEGKWPRSGFLFSTDGGATHVKGYSRAKACLDAAILKTQADGAAEACEGVAPITIAPWRIHDARRTLATGFQRLGVRFEVTEATLNHVSGASRSGISAVYQRYDWAPEKREALGKWAQHLDNLVTPVEPNNVIAFPKVSAGAA